MNRHNSVKELTNNIINIETELNLFSWNAMGTKLWELMRIPLFIGLQNRLSFQNVNHPPKRKLLDIIRIVLLRLKNAIIYNPLLNLKKTNTIVFESSRKYKVDDKYIDIYTKYVCDDLINDNIDFEKYQSNYAFDLLVKKDKITRHLDFIILLSKFLKKLTKVKISEKDKQLISKINISIQNIFNVKFDITPYFVDALKGFKTKYWFFKFIFKKKRVERIYITNYCDKGPIIKAAKDCGAEVIELQHGFSSKEDLIYHYPNTKENSLHYFPDKFYKWKDFPVNFKLPLSSDRIISFSNKHLEYLVNKYKNIQKKDDQILVISQDTLTKEIASSILNNIRYLTNYQIIYKLHPAEQTKWVKIAEFRKLAKYGNVIIKDNSVSIYELMAESKYVLGVYSTAIPEALSFSCKVILLNLPGVEMMSILLQKKDVNLVTDDGHFEKFFSNNIESQKK